MNAAANSASGGVKILPLFLITFSKERRVFTKLSVKLGIPCKAEGLEAWLYFCLTVIYRVFQRLKISVGSDFQYNPTLIFSLIMKEGLYHGQQEKCKWSSSHNLWIL